MGDQRPWTAGFVSKAFSAIEDFGEDFGFTKTALGTSSRGIDLIVI
jgi:hypothetical protein